MSLGCAGGCQVNPLFCGGVGELLPFPSAQDASGVLVIQSQHVLSEAPSVLGDVMAWRGMGLRGLTACAEAEGRAAVYV